jgi:hypothetical protein
MSLPLPWLFSRGDVMYRIISCVAAALLAFCIAVGPSAADDTATCDKAQGDDAVVACGNKRGLGPAAPPDDPTNIQNALDILKRERETLQAQSVDELPAVAVLRRNDPEDYVRFKERYVIGMQGAVEEDALLIARRALRKSLKHQLAVASGDTMREITELYIAYMQRLQVFDPESCVALSDESKGAKLTSRLDREHPVQFAREMAILENIAGADPHTVVSTITTAEADAPLRMAFRPLFQQPLKVELLGRAKLKPSDFAPYCAVAIAFYKAVLDLPDGDDIKLLRYIYAAAARSADDDLRGGGTSGKNIWEDKK